MKEILNMDATILSRELKKGTWDVEEVLRTYYHHIQKINPHLNAVVETRWDDALKEAREIKSQGLKGRSAGVPVSMKESFFVKGTVTSGGLPRHASAPRPCDAEVVRRLKKEGAIILTKTNTPSLCFCQETDNLLYGRTNNPWNLSRSCGGSSGGEGALIAAGGAAVGIGADIGGSIRFPAHFNGVIGFKSGMNQVPDEGLFPKLAHPLQQNMLGIGALSKSVADAQLIHEIIAGKPSPSQNLSEYTLSVPDLCFFTPVNTTTRQLYDQIHSFLKQDFPIDRTLPPHFSDSTQTWFWIMTFDGARSFLQQTEFDHIGQVFWDWLKSKTGLKPRYHHYLTWALLAAEFLKPSPREWKDLLIRWKKTKMEVYDFLKQRILVLPVYHSPALKHGELYRELFSIRKTIFKYLQFITYANTYGLCSLTIPIGESEEHLPVAYQLVTIPGQEDALFRLGTELETRFRGYRRATHYDS